MSFLKRLALLPLLAGMISFSSCDVGGGADTGVSVLVTASTNGVSFIQSDIIAIYDENENEICGDAGDRIFIPPEETLEVYFKLTPILPNLDPSSVRIVKATLNYTPKKDTYEPIPPLEVDIPTVIFGENLETTVVIPVITQEVKEYFFLNNLVGTYQVKVTFDVVEVYYDENFQVSTDFTLDIRNRIEEGIPNLCM
ncbi:MAG: hypothetical protein GXO22_06350 [Aquificae bacterium]|nr:hypothetical protein [Aquificota bacterium]